MKNKSERQHLFIHTNRENDTFFSVLYLLYTPALLLEKTRAWSDLFDEGVVRFVFVPTKFWPVVPSPTFLTLNCRYKMNSRPVASWNIALPSRPVAKNGIFRPVPPRFFVYFPFVPPSKTIFTVPSLRNKLALPSGPAVWPWGHVTSKCCDNHSSVWWLLSSLQAIYFRL